MSKSTKEDTVSTRLAVVKARLAGDSYATIKKKFGKNRLFVKRWVKRFQHDGSVEDAPRTGRPVKLTDENVSTVRQVLKQRRGSVRRAKRTLEGEGVNVHASTVWRAAKKLGMRKVKARKKPRLTSKQKQKRLQWATHASKRLSSWKRVLFVDEKIVELQFGVKEAWVEEKDPAPILPTVKSPPKMMVWGGVCWHGKTKILQIPKGQNMGSEEYIQLLQGNLVEEGKRLFEGQSWKLLEDNAPAHRAKATQEWYQMQGVDVVVGFPPNSPDLNIMENTWRLLDDMLATRRPTTMDGLWKVVQEEWEKLSMVSIQSLVQSLPERLNAVIKAKGGTTKY
jgi:transposase